MYYTFFFYTSELASERVTFISRDFGFIFLFVLCEWIHIAIPFFLLLLMLYCIIFMLFIQIICFFLFLPKNNFTNAFFFLSPLLSWVGAPPKNLCMLITLRLYINPCVFVYKHVCMCYKNNNIFMLLLLPYNILSSATSLCPS